MNPKQKKEIFYQQRLQLKVIKINDFTNLVRSKDYDKIANFIYTNDERNSVLSFDDLKTVVNKLLNADEISKVYAVIEKRMKDDDIKKLKDKQAQQVTPAHAPAVPQNNVAKPEPLPEKKDEPKQ